MKRIVSPFLKNSFFILFVLLSCSGISLAKTVENQVALTELATVPDTVVVVSDSTWMLSTVVTTKGALNYPWRGLRGIFPPESTYSLFAEEGQPKPWNPIYEVPGSKVIKVGSYVTYYRKSFVAEGDTNIALRIACTVDDDIEIYLNGHLLVSELSTKGMNWQYPAHDIYLHPNGQVENGYLGGDEYDYYTVKKVESYLNPDTNVIDIAVRNRAPNDVGGFSFKMELIPGQPLTHYQVDSIVSDDSWMKSTTAIPGIKQGNWVWKGVNFLPDTNTYTKDVQMGQPTRWNHFTENLDARVICCGDIGFYRTSFWLDKADSLDVRIRTYFDDYIEIYINDHFIGREENINFHHNYTGVPHELLFEADGTVSNPGLPGSDSFDTVSTANMDTVFKEGLNHVIVVLQSIGKNNGFVFRMDLSRNGMSVAQKSTEIISESDQKVLTMDDFLIYPNPTESLVFVDLPYVIDELLVTDTQGKVVYREKNVSKTEIDLSDYPSGMYFITAFSASNKVTKKLAKW